VKVERDKSDFGATAQASATPDASVQELIKEYRKMIESLEARVKDLEKQLEQKNVDQKIMYEKMFEKLCGLAGCGK
jgi:hypothetical protein